MSKRRLDKLEGSLSPKEAVIHWLTEAHTYGSLPAYVESLIDQPDTAQPFIAVPAQVEKAVFESMRGQRSAFVKKVMREATGDTVFLLRLVIGLNVHVEETLRVERLRHAALYWWSRALEAAPGTKSDATVPPDWRRGVGTLRGTLTGTDEARAMLEVRYLDGHDCLFPKLATEWRGLCAVAEALTADEGNLEDESARGVAEQRIQQVVRMARADGLEASGRSADSDAIAARVARDAVGASSGAEHG
jgi:hypothetical protein